jgi:NADP-dependent 3-hydroxy acid dehydrogenase YdfG
MPRTIVICGYGPGISDGVARKFGSEGFQVALVARNETRVRDGADELGKAGITAKGFACDLGDTAAVERLIADVRAKLGPITVLHWNAYGSVAADLTKCDVAELRTMFDVGVNGLVVAMQKSLADMKSQKDAAILLTGGGLALYSPQVDAMAVGWQTMGLALVKAAQHKLTGVLHHRLEREGIYVGEVIVLGSVKGTAFDNGQAKLEPSAVAEQFWKIYSGRSEISIQYAG